MLGALDASQRSRVGSIPGRRGCHWKSPYIAPNIPEEPLVRCCAPLELENIKSQRCVSYVVFRHRSVRFGCLGRRLRTGSVVEYSKRRCQSTSFYTALRSIPQYMHLISFNTFLMLHDLADAFCSASIDSEIVPSPHFAIRIALPRAEWPKCTASTLSFRLPVYPYLTSRYSAQANPLSPMVHVLRLTVWLPR